MTTDLRELMAQITEGYCLLQGIPVTRHYTDEQLAEPMVQVREAMKDAEPLVPSWEWSDDGSHRTPDYSRADYQTSGVAGRTIKQGE